MPASEFLALLKKRHRKTSEQFLKPICLVSTTVATKSIPLMKQGGGGYIFNISSLAGVNAHAGMAAYNASKFGLNGFSEALMQEVRHDGIKVSYIMPGSVNTEFGGDSASEEKSWQLQPEDIAQDRDGSNGISRAKSSKSSRNSSDKASEEIMK